MPCNPEHYHWPHFLRQPNNQQIVADMVVNPALVSKLQDVKSYASKLVCQETGEAIEERPLGQFRRFSYEQYEEDAKQDFKKWAKEYENSLDKSLTTNPRTLTHPQILPSTQPTNEPHHGHQLLRDQTFP